LAQDFHTVRSKELRRNKHRGHRHRQGHKRHLQSGGRVTAIPIAVTGGHLDTLDRHILALIRTESGSRSVRDASTSSIDVLHTAGVFPVGFVAGRSGKAAVLQESRGVVGRGQAARVFNAALVALEGTDRDNNARQGKKNPKSRIHFEDCGTWKSLEECTGEISREKLAKNRPDSKAHYSVLVGYDSTYETE